MKVFFFRQFCLKDYTFLESNSSSITCCVQACTIFGGNMFLQKNKENRELWLCKKQTSVNTATNGSSWLVSKLLMNVTLRLMDCSRVLLQSQIRALGQI